MRTQAEITEILNYLIGLLERFIVCPNLSTDVQEALMQKRRLISEGTAALEAVRESHYKRIDRQLSRDPAECGRVNFLHRKIMSLFSPIKQQPAGVAKLERQQLRIALAGETSSGKTALLNAMLNTNLFHVTQEASTHRLTEIRRDPLLRVEVLDESGVACAKIQAKTTWFTDGEYNRLKEEYLMKIKDFIATHTGAGREAAHGITTTPHRRVGVPSPTVGTKNNVMDAVNNATDIGYTVADANSGAAYRTIGKTTTPHLRVEVPAPTTGTKNNATDASNNITNTVPTKKVRIYLPSPVLPSNVTILDTPGFNAHGADSLITEKALAYCHACLFIIDARNALKNKELDNLLNIRSRVSSIFIVLNKMDLVLGDEELDSDGDEAAALTISRVKALLEEEFDSRAVVYPVSAIPRERLPKDAQYYAENLRSMIEDLFEQANHSRLAWHTDRLVKDVLEMAPVINELTGRGIALFEPELLQLMSKTPQPLDQFMVKIKDNIQNSLFYHASAFNKNFIQRLEEEKVAADGNFQEWVIIVLDKPTIQRDAQLFAKHYLKIALNNINAARSHGLQEIAQAINRDLSEMLNEIYNDFPFKTAFQSAGIISILTSLIGIENDTGEKDLAQALEETDYEKELNSEEVTEAPPGLAMLNSVGVLLGGAIGKYLTNSTLEYTKQKISQTFQAATAKLMEDIIELSKEDLDYSRPNSFTSRLNRAIEQQMAVYESIVKQEIAGYKGKRRETEEELNTMQDTATAITDTMNELA